MKFNKSDLFSVALKAGFIPTFANDAAFVTAKGSAAAENDRYFNSTTGFIREFVSAAWRNFNAGLLEGFTKAQIVAEAIAGVSGAKRAYGSISGFANSGDSTGVVRLDLGVITGLSGSYFGDTGFSVAPAVIVAQKQQYSGGEHGWDWGWETHLDVVTNTQIHIRASNGNMINFKVWWMAIGQ